eukprot:gnl/MRDRNA2_/MRDRNA2_717322_c0_seq1.p2 gnl/MRDRNA2_/MRDRNA2_717322_c0~~gnl/MRDRNA2_/MRDRNA2_717322_c0_seq1.p2  ORF type:complete len:101 (-),score=9.90 gnl/MRDRNA2_/MRDRNA2_717322_c0_seq1:231-533(-)
MSEVRNLNPAPGQPKRMPTQLQQTPANENDPCTAQLFFPASPATKHQIAHSRRKPIQYWQDLVAQSRTAASTCQPARQTAICPCDLLSRMLMLPGKCPLH